mmetsp:Transcript_18/g.35  ORF Transcript_18/g.35 Transcript_18/m.35 type:complete len:321 (-) Transcript_18:664-1626(-)
MPRMMPSAYCSTAAGHLSSTRTRHVSLSKLLPSHILPLRPRRSSECSAKTPSSVTKVLTLHARLSRRRERHTSSRRSSSSAASSAPCSRCSHRRVCGFCTPSSRLSRFDRSDLDVPCLIAVTRWASKRSVAMRPHISHSCVSSTSRSGCASLGRVPRRRALRPPVPSPPPPSRSLPARASPRLSACRSVAASSSGNSAHRRSTRRRTAASSPLPPAPRPAPSTVKSFGVFASAPRRKSWKCKAPLGYATCRGSSFLRKSIWAKLSGTSGLPFWCRLLASEWKAAMSAACARVLFLVPPPLYAMMKACELAKLVVECTYSE